MRKTRAHVSSTRRKSSKKNTSEKTDNGWFHAIQSFFDTIYYQLQARWSDISQNNTLFRTSFRTQAGKDSMNVYNFLITLGAVILLIRGLSLLRDILAGVLLVTIALFLLQRKK